MAGQALQFLGSLAAVLVIVAVTFLIGFRQAARLASEDEAYELFRLAPGGFEPVEIGFDKNGASAIARDDRGRLAVLVPHGNQFVFRLLAPGSKISAHGGELKFEGLPGVRVTLGENASDWASTDIGDNSV